MSPPLHCHRTPITYTVLIHSWSRNNTASMESNISLQRSSDQARLFTPFPLSAELLPMVNRAKPPFNTLPDRAGDTAVIAHMHHLHVVLHNPRHKLGSTDSGKGNLFTYLQGWNQMASLHI